MIRATKSDSVYTFGNYKISINNCPEIDVEDLKLSMVQEFLELEEPNGYITRKEPSPKPVEAIIDFKFPLPNADTNQTWFYQFNNTNVVGAHLARVRLNICMDKDFTMFFIGYLTATGINYDLNRYDTIDFRFNGSVGQDINLVPDPYAKDQEEIDEISAPTAEELAEDFEFVTKKVIDEIKKEEPKEEIIVIERKITF